MADSGTRPSSVEEIPSRRNKSGGKLVEEAIDYFTCMEIGKTIEQEATYTEKIDEETFSNEIIGQFSKLQAPKGNVKFGDKEIVVFNEGDTLGQSKNANPSIKPLPILKVSPNSPSDNNVKFVEKEDQKTSQQQERLFEIFRRCYTLCNIPMSQFHENDLFESFKKLSEGIRKAFKAKDECYKYIRYEEKRRHSQEVQKLEKIIKELKQNDKKHDSSSASMSLQINELQAHVDEYRGEIKDLTAQVTSTNYENSELRAKTNELQMTKNQLQEKMDSLLTRCKQLENGQEEKIELTRQNEKLNNDYGTLQDRYERFVKKHESLETQYGEIYQSNQQLTAKVDSLTKGVDKWTHDHKELQIAYNDLEAVKQDLNDKLSQERTKTNALEIKFTKLQKDSQDSKTTFKNKLKELIDENINLKSQVERWRVDYEQTKTKYDKLVSEQRETVKQRDKFCRDSDQSFKKTVELQLQLDQHVKFKEQAIKFNSEKEACLIALKKLDFDYCNLQNSLEQAFSENRHLIQLRKEMNNKLKTDAFKIDTLTRQVLKQNSTIDQLQQKVHRTRKRDVLKPLANTNK